MPAWNETFISKVIFKLKIKEALKLLKFHTYVRRVHYLYNNMTYQKCIKYFLNTNLNIIQMLFNKKVFQGFFLLIA